MSRPVDINTLLNRKKQLSNGGSTIATNKVTKNTASNGDEKPKFLSKEERYRLIQDMESNNKRSSIDPDLELVNEIISSTATRNVSVQRTDVDEEKAYDNPFNTGQKTCFTKTVIHTKKSTKDRRFQFDWDADEDTLQDYTPIVQRKFMLPNNSNKNKKELDYMGKHWKEKSLSEMTPRDWRILREDFNITIKSGDSSSIKSPLRNWDELKLLPPILDDILINKLNFKDPTPIQRITIPNILLQNDRDFIGVASTGSGKTLAFILPILIKLLETGDKPINLKKIDGPMSLILVPTRELAQQIQSEADKIISFLRPSYNFNTCSIVGGYSLEEISRNLNEKACDLLIATPGKLIECLENHILTIQKISFLVLDEADKMIDLGFEDQLKSILNQIKIENVLTNYKILMFTATMSTPIEKIARGYLNQPINAIINADGSKSSIPQIRQIIEYCPSEEQRYQKIVSLLKSHPNELVIIFINYKSTADWLANKFQNERTSYSSSRSAFKCTVLHGSKSQEQREHSLQLLRSHRVQILIATNVAARGLDIPNVTTVFNFQMSKTFEDYVHRIGRTGRAGNTGLAITYLGDEEDQDIANELYSYQREHNPLNNNIFQDVLKKKYGVGKPQFEAILQ
ncbi:mRNA splicing protein PRP28 NDAI_0C05120 [Naumovozyma dairenensis CBS 421]|uniref:RNA helicase n=1 Tax=Naumovozyma dairenensis (strain ATCC 10597 / BCRC 20456 / CBS 421 / NBRC 0211 / NRRL Y-12639) TaxID=1071378 RepID=G0W8R0_NAUDC|nr:hypothetical protein NDAI_0C05120 [Naumovozyma dairenensis CBS 421]CCD24171.1 hypothetical protein NDAI_0C05120 [Naumovozyma dairenensis CBS 421]